jgi:hypothetical protein
VLVGFWLFSIWNCFWFAFGCFVRVAAQELDAADNIDLLAIIQVSISSNCDGGCLRCCVYRAAAAAAAAAGVV